MMFSATPEQGLKLLEGREYHEDEDINTICFYIMEFEKMGITLAKEGYGFGRPTPMDRAIVWEMIVNGIERFKAGKPL